ncbi:cysteine proteinase [Pelomyxa schiedti]|nr:cysteine proteinase [Pelomyxa schiedti]
MKAVLVLLFVAVASASLAEFRQWAVEHGKTYAPLQEQLRYRIWSKNMKEFAKFNAEGHSWTVGPNKFTDLTPEEFESQYLMRPQIHPNVTVISAPTAVADVDWTSKCTGVKDQGQCGSCWTFGSIGAIEACRNILGDGQLISLSEQDLVDCCTGICCSGCDGGTIVGAFKCAESGLPTEASYPYTAVDTADCLKSTKVTKVTSYTSVTSGSVSGLQTALETQPIAVAIDARLLSSYKSGIWCPSACSTSSLDHAVLLVGLNNAQAYYKIKNSWGTSWGESGYFRMCIGTNQCGIATDAAYPKGCAKV